MQKRGLSTIIETIILILILLILLGLVSTFIFNLINSKSEESKNSVDKILEIAKKNNTSTTPEIIISILEPFPASKGIAVKRNEMFLLSFNITCLEEDCGEINVTLDPREI